MSGPRVVTSDAAASGGIERTIEVAHRERGHLIRNSLCDGLVVECFQRRIKLCQQISLVRQLLRVSIPSAELNKEDLATHVERSAELHQLRDLSHLVTKRCIREGNREHRILAELLTHVPSLLCQRARR